MGSSTRISGSEAAALYSRTLRQHERATVLRERIVAQLAITSVGDPDQETDLDSRLATAEEATTPNAVLTSREQLASIAVRSLVDEMIEGFGGRV
ncbi:MAG TPA: hypothetical protein VG992_01570 [Candidatus Saccharimonadales bacterium]|nr:hypothetical protein [Candidatus Saccharimonadales bacterium]